MQVRRKQQTHSDENESQLTHPALLTEINTAIDLLETAKKKSLAKSAGWIKFFGSMTMALELGGAIFCLLDTIRASVNIPTLMTYIQLKRAYGWSNTNTYADEYLKNRYVKPWVLEPIRGGFDPMSAMLTQPLMGAVCTLSLCTILSMSMWLRIDSEEKEHYAALSDDDKQYINNVLDKLDRNPITSKNFTSVLGYLKNKSSESKTPVSLLNEQRPKQSSFSSWFNFYSQGAEANDATNIHSVPARRLTSQ
jgi:hypothetical protein